MHGMKFCKAAAAVIPEVNITSPKYLWTEGL